MSDLTPLPDAALGRLFRQTRTVHAFQNVPASDATLHQRCGLLAWGRRPSTRSPRAAHEAARIV